MGIEIVKVPDLGGVENVTVLEVLVSPGDKIEIDTPLLTLESDKATMEVPSSKSGEVKDILVSVGQAINQGDDIIRISTVDEKSVSDDKAISSQDRIDPVDNMAKESTNNISTGGKKANMSQSFSSSDVYAGPGVRRLAYELGIDLKKVRASGYKNRVQKEDLNNYIRQKMASSDSSFPKVKFENPEKFGDVESVNLSKIKLATSSHMTKSYLNIPHVTQFDKVDITDLEKFRQSQKKEMEKKSVRLTMLAFIIKALVEAFKKHPNINSSYDVDGAKIWIKKHYHIGFAVDTPLGLVVPVIRNVDKATVEQIASSLSSLSQKARDGQLTPQEMVGGGFTVSSLGGIGGEYFTPIVNSPQVAILGVSKSKFEPVWEGGEFVPRLMLPLSLSYDHRVIDGAEAMRFLKDYAQILSSMHGLL